MTRIATETKVIRDEAMGIDRKVIAGQPVPPDLVAAYEEAGGALTEAPAVTSNRLRDDDAPAPVIASETLVVEDKAMGIHRKVVAGQPVPPDLVEAYQAAGGEAADQGGSEPDPDPVVDYDDWKVDDLKTEVEKRGLDVEGSGQDGRVVKDDLVDALKADDAGE